MSDRIAELRRQRAVLEEHLAWLDREIAAEARHVPAARVVAPSPITPGLPAASPARTLSTAAGGDATVATTVTVVAPTLARGSVSGAAASPRHDALLDEYRVRPDAVKNDVRKGCFLYFALAFVLLGIGVTILWFALRH